MFRRINKIIAAGIGLLILALTASNASGQYCIGSTRFVAHGENGKILTDPEMKKVKVKAIDGVNVSLEKDEKGRAFYVVENRRSLVGYTVEVKNPLRFGFCGEIKDLTLLYKNAEMRLIFDVGEHNTVYEIDSPPFQKGVFRPPSLKCAGGKSPPLIDNNNTGVCSVSADNWKKLKQ